MNPVSTSNLLGLRQITFREDFEHPDERPCPPWCWVAAHNPNGYEHEINPKAGRLATKRHTMEADIEVRASLYGARSDSEGVRAATWEPRLEQNGESEAFIDIGLRSYGWAQGTGYESKYDHSRMRLLIQDACELVTALEYLIDVAKGVREPYIEHQDCLCADDTLQECAAARN